MFLVIHSFFSINKEDGSLTDDEMETAEKYSGKTDEEMETEKIHDTYRKSVRLTSDQLVSGLLIYPAYGTCNLIGCYVQIICICVY